MEMVTKIILKGEQNKVCKKKEKNGFLRFQSFTSYPLPKITIPQTFLLTHILDI